MNGTRAAAGRPYGQFQMAIRTPNRRSIRLPGYDYSSAGMYFITLVAHSRACIFGDIRDDGSHLSELGRLAHDEWLGTAIIRNEIGLGAFVLMPNHLHAIVQINCSAALDDAHQMVDETDRERARMPAGPAKGSLAALVSGYKSAVTRHSRDALGNPDFRVWQRNYYEHCLLYTSPSPRD